MSTCSAFLRLNQIAHLLTFLTRRRHILKAGAAKRLRRAHVVVRRRIGSHRTAFDDAGVMGAGIVDHSLQQRACKILSAKFAIDEEARHRPDRRVINAWQCAVSLQRSLALTRRDRTPSDRLLFVVGENADRRAVAHQLFQRGHALFFA